MAIRKIKDKEKRARKPFLSANDIKRGLEDAEMDALVIRKNLNDIVYMLNSDEQYTDVELKADLTAVAKQAEGLARYLG